MAYLTMLLARLEALNLRPRTVTERVGGGGLACLDGAEESFPGGPTAHLAAEDVDGAAPPQAPLEVAVHLVQPRGVGVSGCEGLQGERQHFQAGQVRVYHGVVGRRLLRRLQGSER